MWQTYSKHTTCDCVDIRPELSSHLNRKSVEARYGCQDSNGMQCNGQALEHVECRGQATTVVAKLRERGGLSCALTWLALPLSTLTARLSIAPRGHCHFERSCKPQLFDVGMGQD